MGFLVDKESRGGDETLCGSTPPSSPQPIPLAQGLAYTYSEFVKDSNEGNGQHTGSKVECSNFANVRSHGFSSVRRGWKSPVNSQAVGSDW